MKNEFIYTVEITPEGFKPGGIQTNKYRHNFADPFKARKEAINSALSALFDNESVEEDSDDEEGIVTVEVHFEFNGQTHQIFGEDKEKVLLGLVAEANQYLNSGLINKEELASVYKNRKSFEEDPFNPVVVLFLDELKHWSNMEYEVLHILGDNMDEIL